MDALHYNCLFFFLRALYYLPYIPELVHTEDFVVLRKNSHRHEHHWKLIFSVKTVLYSALYPKDLYFVYSFIKNNWKSQECSVDITSYRRTSHPYQYIFYEGRLNVCIDALHFVYDNNPIQGQCSVHCPVL